MNFNYYKWSSDISDRLYAYFRPKRFIIQDFFKTIADGLDLGLCSGLIFFLIIFFYRVVLFSDQAFYSKIIIGLVFGEGLYLSVMKTIDLIKRIQERYKNGKNKRKQ